MKQPSARRQKPTCVLVLQGGGALGAYHIGVYQALHEHGFEPDWLCGISIGAINAAVLAGNPPEQRLAQLEALWQAISWPELLPHSANTAVQGFWNTLSNAQALAFGQPGFFTPRPINPFFSPSGTPATESFYDTAPLRQTLLEYADFARIGRDGTRLSVGVTDVEIGELAFFDSTTTPGGLAPEHVIASGSLPPGFAATEIGGRFYWDGACVSNTPLEAVLNDTPPGHTVAFVIDLWSAAGAAPTTMNEVLWRAKQIQYASRTAHHVELGGDQGEFAPRARDGERHEGKVRRTTHDAAGRHRACHLSSGRGSDPGERRGVLPRLDRRATCRRLRRHGPGARGAALDARAEARAAGGDDPPREPPAGHDPRRAEPAHHLGPHRADASWMTGGE